MLFYGESCDCTLSINGKSRAELPSLFETISLPLNRVECGIACCHRRRPVDPRGDVAWETESKTILTIVHNALQFLDGWETPVTMACKTWGGIEHMKKDVVGVAPRIHTVYPVNTTHVVFQLPYQQRVIIRERVIPIVHVTQQRPALPIAGED